MSVFVQTKYLLFFITPWGNNIWQGPWVLLRVSNNKLYVNRKKYFCLKNLIAIYLYTQYVYECMLRTCTCVDVHVHVHFIALPKFANVLLRSIYFFNIYEVSANNAICTDTCSLTRLIYEVFYLAAAIFFFPQVFKGHGRWLNEHERPHPKRKSAELRHSGCAFYYKLCQGISQMAAR